MMLDAPILTDRLILGNLDPDTLGPYWRELNDPEINRYLEVRHRQQTADGNRTYVSSQNASEISLLLGIRLRSDSRHIGNLKLALTPPHRRADLGIVIWDRAQWGQGYASEAIAAASRYAFEALSVRKVTAGAYAANIASIRAFRRAGFEIEGSRREHWRDGDQWTDGILLCRFSTDFATKKDLQT